MSFIAHVATAPPTPSSSLAHLSLSEYNQSNPIDLTLDDEDEDDHASNAGPSSSHAHSQLERNLKRRRIDSLSPYSGVSWLHPPAFGSLGSVYTGQAPDMRHGIMEARNAAPAHMSEFASYIPPLAGSSRSSSIHQPPSASPPIMTPSPFVAVARTQHESKQIIDLTTSPSPPPESLLSSQSQGVENLPPRTPVCIGQLQAKALILYPVSYLHSQAQVQGQDEWADVRLQADSEPANSTTIHISAPHGTCSPENPSEESFALVETSAAKHLGPMLFKGLIRLEGKIKRGSPNLPILPMVMLVFTPKGNVPVVGNFLKQIRLLLDHPSWPFDYIRIRHYQNPHSPPPGGHVQASLAHRTMVQNRWSTQAPNGKSVEIQRNQVDDLFRSLKDGDELEETEATADVASPLYPHQKKALTFLLERERERLGSDGRSSSLWQETLNPITGQMSWQHAVTNQERFESPHECKGSILADDMGLGKTITCVALIAATYKSAQEFARVPVECVDPGPKVREEDSLSAAHFANSVWGVSMTNPSGSSSNGKGKRSRQDTKAEADYARARRIKLRSRATLIICPLSTVSNWEDQIREHWNGPVTIIGGGSCVSSSAVSSSSGSKQRNGHSMRICIYHGNARRAEPEFLADFDAVITTFSTLATEYSKQTRSIANSEECAEEEPDGDHCWPEAGTTAESTKSKALKRKKCTEITSALQSVHWFRVVLDEAHSIKETNTVASRASCDLIADRRLCLTGTPVQNKLDDVFALIKFLRLQPLDDKNIWTEYIGTPVKYGQSLGVVRLQTVMKCITLRRTKDQTMPNGKKILALPPRRDEIRYLRFAEPEQAIYDAYFTESRNEFNELSHRNEVMKNYVGILQKILRLRQICDHYELVQNKDSCNNKFDGATYEDIAATIDRDGIDASRAAAIFNLLRESAITQCVECGIELATVTEPSQSETPNEEPPKRGRKPKALISKSRAGSPIAIIPVLTKCQHLFCIACYRNCICPGWPDVPPDTSRCCSTCSTSLCPSDAVEIRLDTPSSEPKKRRTKKEKRPKGQLIVNYASSTKIDALMMDLVTFSRSNPYSANFDVSSVEIQELDSSCNVVSEEPIKTVVFSQWTTMLDKIEDALEQANIRYDRLDGTMKRDDRTKAMDALKYDPACEVLLVSLKAGGVGLNLTAACRVYIMDPYWNPAVENQAVDRIHRLGQKRPVTTVKLIIEGSIEAKLLDIQKKKSDLAKMTLGHNKAELMQRRMEELNQLFAS